jgi:hypothetical protein
LLQLQRLNWGLDTGLWRVYEHREKPNGVRLALSVNSSSIAVLGGAAMETLQWGGTCCPLPSRRRAREKEVRHPGEEVGHHDMVSTDVNFIQAKL